ncbi:hypothetical protein [Flavihumibacter sp. UBA7668]|uniref:hypothetical protein n=1 Tax=Flavihumibacter sp. UBA7668 TaxID=1946542 RepID=UPI0025BE9DCD|nr:hypothetical protein [Flavihumibacter sp. UBA7668]
MNISIYTKGFSAGLIQQIKNRFADYKMDIEFHPSFRFNEQTDQGFLPIKLKIQPGSIARYDHIDYEILTGFELIFSDYNFEEEVKGIQQQAQLTASRSFISRLFGGSKKKSTAEDDSFAGMEHIERLMNCRKYILLKWMSWNKTELRISLYFAAILAELTDGVIYDPQSGRYLSGQQALELFPSEVEEYEQSFTTEAFTVDRFEGWL